MTREKTLFVAWQRKDTRRLWFPVGRLDVDVNGTGFRFRYTEGARRAKKATHFVELHQFPNLETAYTSDYLFAFFQNRIIAPSRPDRLTYLGALDLGSDAGPYEILSVSGGTRVTDPFEVFPMLGKSADGTFSCRFFLRGRMYVTEEALSRIDRLVQNEALDISLDENNSIDDLAIAIRASENGDPSGLRIGWTPRYLVRDLAAVLSKDPHSLRARVARLNPVPAPSTQRLLIELRGNWGTHTPMSDPDLVPLVP